MTRWWWLLSASSVAATVIVLFFLPAAFGGPDAIPEQPPGAGPIVHASVSVPRAGGETETLRVEDVLNSHLDVSAARVLAVGEEGMAILGPSLDGEGVCLVLENPADSQVLSCGSTPDFARTGIYVSHTPPGEGLRGAFAAPEGFERITVNGSLIANPHGAIVFSLPPSADHLELVASAANDVIRVEHDISPMR